MSNPTTIPGSEVHQGLSAGSHRVIHVKGIAADAVFLRILGVNYVHLKTADEGDLYVTEHGVPFLEHLRPANWYEETWFRSKRERLQGTSTVYKVPTKPVAERVCPSIDLVVKWSRVGQEIPLDTFTLNQAINTEFNTPFEEFSLVEELRAGNYGPRNLRILTQKPLAIYVPPEKMQLWQTGRSKDKILSKIARHPGIEIDILRSYILLYHWIDGVNAVDAYRASFHDAKNGQEQLTHLIKRVEEDLAAKGFQVSDNKPQHFILRMKQGDVKRRRDGTVLWAYIDYELLGRTPAHEEAVKASGRSRYLQMQRDRFLPHAEKELPNQLWRQRVLNVPYVYGRSESTNGALWVVGNDPELFGYFLPERWRTKQIRLSNENQTYYTQTKDRIHLVWKVSRVGEIPPGDFSDPGYERRLMIGFNSPFEEFQIALELQRLGVKTTYPRAIYMTGQPTDLSGTILDDRRFRRYAEVLTPEGTAALRMDRDYISIWGYWRGLEDENATLESGHWTPIDALSAWNKGLISQATLEELVQRQRETLLAVGYQDLSLRGDHILISHIPGGDIKRDSKNQIELRQCNFELVGRLTGEKNSA